MDTKKNITIFIAMYLYGGDECRVQITQMIFKHYCNVKQKFSGKANFNFVILGSDKEISKNLTLKYFNENEYYEYDQTKINDFYTMLSDKIKTGINIAAKSEDDIIFWAGSNDFIPFDFFSQVLDFYDPNKKQIYGIDQFKNGLNTSMMYEHDIHSQKIDLDKCIWIDSEKNTNRVRYTGGIIGINKKLYVEYPDILKLWSCHEEHVEIHTMMIKGIDRFNSKNIYWFNIKCDSKKEIHTLDELKKMHIKCGSLLCYDDIPDKELLDKNISYVNSLFKFN